MAKSVYIHIPFCDNICSYCDFCKLYTNEKFIDKYLNSLENEIENKLKISVNSVKQLKNTITYLNEILDKTFVYQVIKTFNVNDDDFNVIITLKNNLTIIIKGTYLINSLIENLNLEYEHNKERVIAYE